MLARAFCGCLLALLAAGRGATAQTAEAPGAVSGAPATGPAAARPPLASAPAKDSLHEARGRSAARSIALSGFLVVRTVAHSVPGGSTTLSWAELDGAIEQGRTLQAAVALARIGTQWLLAAGFLDLHVGSAGIAPRGSLFAERGMHLQVGRFDVPFGGDWQRFAPPARTLSSAPAITDQLSDGGLNDVGLRAYSVGARWNASAWVVRGALAGRALGTRLALTPFSNPFVLRASGTERPLEIGLSAHLDGRDGRIDDQRAALDVDLHHRDVHVAAEWQHRRVVHDARGLTSGRAHGWHISTDLPVVSYRSIGTLLLGRWEAVHADALGTTGLGMATAFQRAIAGTRLALGSWALLKCEVGWRLGGVPATNTLPARSWLLNAIVQW